jgi:hypothetical protein
MIQKFNEHKNIIIFPKSEKEVDELCDKFYIREYVTNSDFSIDVPDGVFMMQNSLDQLPIKFSHVSGCFDCSDNYLTSLEGSPIFVDDEFDCRNNQLFSLIGGPDYVSGDYRCNYNRLTDLKGSPHHIERDFDFSNNKTLYSLEGCPREIDKSIIYGNCPIAEIINIFTFPDPGKSILCKHRIFEFWNKYQPVFQEGGSRWYVDDRRFREMYASIVGHEYKKDYLQFIHYSVK